MIGHQRCFASSISCFRAVIFWGHLDWLVSRDGLIEFLHEFSLCKKVISKYIHFRETNKAHNLKNIMVQIVKAELGIPFNYPLHVPYINSFDKMRCNLKKNYRGLLSEYMISKTSKHEHMRFMKFHSFVSPTVGCIPNLRMNFPNHPLRKEALCSSFAECTGPHQPCISKLTYDPGVELRSHACELNMLVTLLFCLTLGWWHCSFFHNLT